VANRIYITSVHWNPCVELQAIGRAYRKGQLAKVICTRVLMTDTIEEKCMQIQETKLDMISEAMDDTSIINHMFGSGSASGSASASAAAAVPKQIEDADKLLDAEIDAFFS